MLLQIGQRPPSMEEKKQNALYSWNVFFNQLEIVHSDTRGK